MNAVERVLHSDPMVDPTDVPVRFTKITSEAYVVEIFAYVLTPDFNQFLKAQSDLLLQIMEAAAHAGVVFALPIQESIAGSLSPLRAQDIEVNA
jgi:MscS family membrane protein